MPSGFAASDPAASLAAGLMCGKTAIAGMPSAAARFASLTTSSRFTRSTPGIDGKGVRGESPSDSTMVQIKSFVVRVFSRTKPRDHGALRVRRILVVGKDGTGKTSKSLNLRQNFRAYNLEN